MEIVEKIQKDPRDTIVEFTLDTLDVTSPSELSTESTNTLFQQLIDAREIEDINGTYDGIVLKTKMVSAGTSKNLDVIYADVDQEGMDIDQDLENRRRTKVYLSENGKTARISMNTENRELDKWGSANYRPQEPQVQEYIRNPKGQGWTKLEDLEEDLAEEFLSKIEVHNLDGNGKKRLSETKSTNLEQIVTEIAPLLKIDTSEIKSVAEQSTEGYLMGLSDEQISGAKEIKIVDKFDPETWYVINSDGNFHSIFTKVPTSE